MAEYAWVRLTRLCGCNYKVPVKRTKNGKSVIVPDPQTEGVKYRIPAGRFDSGRGAARGSWWISPWSEKAEQTTRQEANWMD